MRFGQSPEPVGSPSCRSLGPAYDALQLRKRRRAPGLEQATRNHALCIADFQHSCEGWRFFWFVSTDTSQSVVSSEPRPYPVCGPQCRLLLKSWMLPRGPKLTAFKVLLGFPVSKRSQEIRATTAANRLVPSETMLGTITAMPQSTAIPTIQPAFRFFTSFVIC